MIRWTRNWSTSPHHHRWPWPSPPDLGAVETLLITDATMGKVTLPLRMGENPGFQFKTHPKINKQLFSTESTLG